MFVSILKKKIKCELFKNKNRTKHQGRYFIPVILSHGTWPLGNTRRISFDRIYLFDVNGVLFQKLFWPSVKKNVLLIEIMFWKAKNLQNLWDN